MGCRQSAQILAMATALPRYRAGTIAVNHGTEGNKPAAIRSAAVTSWMATKAG